MILKDKLNCSSYLAIPWSALVQFVLTNPVRVMFHHMMWSYHKMFPNFSLDISFPVFIDAIDLNLANLSSGYLSPPTDAEVSYASDVL